MGRYWDDPDYPREDPWRVLADWLLLAAIGAAFLAVAIFVNR